MGLENQDALVAIDTASDKVVGQTPIGQAPQALAYVPNAVPTGDGLQNLQPLGVAGMVAHLTLASPGATGPAPTSVSLFDQGLTQILEASVTGLPPKQPFVLALSNQPDGGGPLQPLSSFMTNPAGSAIVMPWARSARSCRARTTSRDAISSSSPGPPSSRAPSSRCNRPATPDSR